MAKFVFVTGGVVSALGKGIASASLGNLLKARGFNVILQKFDPYLNVDPGHHEPVPARRGLRHSTTAPRPTWTWATTSAFCARGWAATTTSPPARSTRPRDPQGAPRRVPGPHGAGHPARHRRDQGQHPLPVDNAGDADVAMVEIGGTVGDIESLPFLEAIRQMRRGGQPMATTMFMHLTLVPYIRTAGEIKTKPTQHSVGSCAASASSPTS
jgi:CTP synthase